MKLGRWDRVRESVKQRQVYVCMFSRMFNQPCVYLHLHVCGWAGVHVHGFLQCPLCIVWMFLHICVYFSISLSLCGGICCEPLPLTSISHPTVMSVLLPLLYLRGQHDRRQHKLQIPTGVCPMWCVLLIARCVYRWMWLCVFLSIYAFPSDSPSTWYKLWCSSF